MTGIRRLELIEHLSEAELDTAINEAQMADEAVTRRFADRSTVPTGVSSNISTGEAV